MARSFDALFARLERPVSPEPAFADDLFERLVDDAGLRRGRARRRHAVTPTAARQLAWVAVLAALLIGLLGLLALGRGGRQLFSTTAPTPSVEVAVAGPTPHIGSSLLSIGSTPPSWTGTFLDGGRFSTDELRGRPAAILMWCQCARGRELRLFVEAAKARDDVALVFVSLDPAGTTRGAVDDLAMDLPVVVDPAMDLLTAWGIEGFPALVLLRADGSLADIQQVTYGEAKLTALLDALSSDGSIPAPDTRTPSPLDPSGHEVLSPLLAVGSIPPELSGPRLDGGRLSTADLAGRPTVVVFWLPPRADGSTQDDTPTPDNLLEELQRRGNAAQLLFVVESEAAPGDAERYLAAKAPDANVIVDRTGELLSRWDLTFTQSVVLLDAEGRVARVAGPEALSNPAAVLDALESP
jgi:hypothetical protein